MNPAYMQGGVFIALTVEQAKQLRDQAAKGGLRFEGVGSG